jgi:predicted RNase H-like nuclease (RuvC/YqgF family)
MVAIKDMALNTHPIKTNQHSHQHDNLLFSAEEMKQVDKSVSHNKLLKIVASLVIVITVTTAGLYLNHISHQSTDNNITTSSSEQKPTNNPITNTTSNNSSIDSTTTLQAKAAAKQAEADKLAAQAKQYMDTGNNDLANALNQQAAEQQAAADQAAQYAADSAKIQSLQEQQQAASAAQQQAIAQQQAALQQCQQQKSAADAPIISQINNLQSQINDSMQQQIQAARDGTTSTQLNTNISHDESMQSALQSQLNTINAQYSC